MTITPENNLQGLRGWLLVVGIGVIVAPLSILAFVMPAYYGMLSNGAWDVLTTPGNPAYSSLWKPILISEMFVNAGLLFVRLYIVYLFFTQRKSFPTWLIGVMVFSVVFILLDSIVVAIALPSAPVFDGETKRELFRAVIAAVVWIPYLLISKRVKATFIN